MRKLHANKCLEWTDHHAPHPLPKQQHCTLSCLTPPALLPRFLEATAARAVAAPKPPCRQSSGGLQLVPPAALPSAMAAVAKAAAAQAAANPPPGGLASRVGSAPACGEADGMVESEPGPSSHSRLAASRVSALHFCRCTGCSCGSASCCACWPSRSCSCWRCRVVGVMTAPAGAAAAAGVRCCTGSSSARAGMAGGGLLKP